MLSRYFCAPEPRCGERAAKLLTSTKAAAPERCSATASRLPRGVLVHRAALWWTALNALPTLAPTQDTEGDVSPAFAFSPSTFKSKEARIAEFNDADRCPALQWLMVSFKSL